MKKRVVIAILAGLLATSFSASIVAATPPPWIDERLTGPTTADPGDIARFTARAYNCGEDASRLAVEYELLGDWNTEPTTDLLTIDNEQIVLDVVVGNFAGNGAIDIRVLCSLPEKRFRYSTRLRVTGTAGPSGGDPNAGITPELVFRDAEVAPFSRIVGSGNRPCTGGEILSRRLSVWAGSGKWEKEPSYRVALQNDIPVFEVLNIGKPVFDADRPDVQLVYAEIVCLNNVKDELRYEGIITVRDTNQPAAPNPGNPPVGSNVRGAISVDPAQVTEGQRVTISNTSSSPCAGLVLPYGASGIASTDQGKIDDSIVRGSESGDAIKPDASGNWAVGLTFRDGFLGGQDVRRITVTMACASRVNGATSIDFIYQPAAISVVARGAQAPATTAGSGAGAPATTAGSTGGTPATGSVDPQTGTPVDPQSGGVAAPSPLGGFSIPSGESVDAAGDLILPRAYLDGDTQQLIEIATGLVIGEYDLVSGQFVDPNTGAVTGIVDPATGELIDAATGIQIGISTTPPSARDGAALLGLGGEGTADEAADDSGSNTLVIVLAAVAGALLLAVIALVVSRPKKPTLPPPPIA
ncbi:MAG: hypothetical protein ACO3LJ_10815 [Ilumatobacteraceae bacterium]